VSTSASRPTTSSSSRTLSPPPTRRTSVGAGPSRWPVPRAPTR